MILIIRKNSQNKNYIENNLKKLNIQKINTLNFKILATTAVKIILYLFQKQSIKNKVEFQFIKI